MLLTPTEVVKLIESIADVAVTLLLAYVVYRIAGLVESLNRKIKHEEKP